MQAAGLADQFERANRLGVQLAFEAREEWAAANKEVLGRGQRMMPLIAGSVSCHAPGNEQDKTQGKVPWPSAEQEAANYAEQATLLVEEGIDILFTEMAWNKEHGLRCAQALGALVDVPIFFGLVVFSKLPQLSLGDIRDGQKMEGLGNASFQEEITQKMTKRSNGTAPDSWPVETAVQELLAANSNIVGFNVHHTKMQNTLPALRAIRAAGWTGPLGAYPDHGVWLRTGWGNEPLEPAFLAEQARLWEHEAGAQLVGGCCGVGVDHVSGLRRQWADIE